MLSLVEFFAVSVGSALVAYTFTSWTSGLTWSCIIVAALFRIIREWETEDEGYVIEYVEDPEDANGGVAANTYQQMPVSRRGALNKEYSLTETDSRGSIDPSRKTSDGMMGSPLCRSRSTRNSSW